MAGTRNTKQKKSSKEAKEQPPHELLKNVIEHAAFDGTRAKMQHLVEKMREAVEAGRWMALIFRLEPNREGEIRLHSEFTTHAFPIEEYVGAFQHIRNHFRNSTLRATRAITGDQDDAGTDEGAEAPLGDEPDIVGE